MSGTRRHRPFAIWIALRADAVDLAVCSAQGGDAGPRDAAAHALAHCPYCHLLTTSPGLAPAPPSEGLGAARRHERPSAFLATPRTLPVWVSARARAPPPRNDPAQAGPRR